MQALSVVAVAFQKPMVVLNTAIHRRLVSVCKTERIRVNDKIGANRELSLMSRAEQRCSIQRFRENFKITFYSVFRQKLLIGDKNELFKVVVTYD